MPDAPVIDNAIHIIVHLHMLFLQSSDTLAFLHKHPLRHVLRFCGVANMLLTHIG